MDNIWKPTEDKMYNIEVISYLFENDQAVIYVNMQGEKDNIGNLRVTYPSLVSKVKKAMEIGYKPPFFARIQYTGKNAKDQLLFKMWVE